VVLNDHARLQDAQQDELRALQARLAALQKDLVDRWAPSLLLLENPSIQAFKHQALMLFITSQALCLIIQHRFCTACPSPELPPDVAAAITCRQHTERLRDRAAAILKEELAEMRRREKRAEVDVNYVKDVIVRCSPRSCT
jgi:hypothetical protein